MNKSEELDRYLDQANTHLLNRDWKRYFSNRRTYYLKGGKRHHYSIGTSGADTASLIKQTNAHFDNKLSIQQDEVIVDFYPASLIGLGRTKREILVNGASFIEEHGQWGSGYVCLTDKNLHIVTIVELTKLLPNQSRVLSLFASLIPGGDRTKKLTADQSWKVPYLAIKYVEPFIDPLLKDMKSIRIATATDTWDIYTLWDAHQEALLFGLNLARESGFTKETPSTNRDSHSYAPDVMQLIVELGELKERGLISETEFNDKKKELLSRL